GSYAINPYTKEKIPVWVADYVLIGYGTGAIMAVPAGDDRDREFAEKFGLPVVDWEKDIPKKPLGTPKVTYRMRDWLISRQRYWGCPIPIAYDSDGDPHPIPEDQLPVRIPEVKDFKPDDSGRSALAKAEDWLKVKVFNEKTGKVEEMTRETDTLDGYACSSWYLWRYASPTEKSAAWDPEKIQYWEPLDVYVGADHAVAHLLYIRFWAKFFADEGKLPFREPVKKLLYNGYINAPDGKKMSKSKGNVIDPLDVIDQGYGADTLRTYEMFIGPYDLDAAWNPRSVGGVYRFLSRVYNLAFINVSSSDSAASDSKNYSSHKSECLDSSSAEPLTDCCNFNDREARTSEKKHLERKVARNKVIKKVTTDLSRASFNTAVSTLMEYVNTLYKSGAEKDDIIVLAKLLKPFAPHLSSEILEKYNSDDSWPKLDESLLEEEVVQIIVQVNGKLRARLNVEADLLDDEAKILEIALAEENVKKFVPNSPKRVIYVKKSKLLNLVA
ncbi:class I tRNA ligase family protein, partial [Candidatus Saccharibacteria bacterium]|nr:class I tRNA ligase family protein [Candidatus Saccharibacteria bacterium]